MAGILSPIHHCSIFLFLMLTITTSVWTQRNFFGGFPDALNKTDLDYFGPMIQSLSQYDRSQLRADLRWMKVNYSVCSLTTIKHIKTGKSVLGFYFIWDDIESIVGLTEKATRASLYIRPESDRGRQGINITSLEDSYLQASRECYQHHIQAALKAPNSRNSLDIYAYATYPGTRYCTLGISVNTLYNIVSPEAPLKQLDDCCKIRSLCIIRMPSRFFGKYLRSADTIKRVGCKCQQEFYSCLRKVNTSDSRAVETLFFQIFRLDCIASRCTNPLDAEVPCPDDYNSAPHITHTYIWSRFNITDTAISTNFIN